MWKYQDWLFWYSKGIRAELSLLKNLLHLATDKAMHSEKLREENSFIDYPQIRACGHVCPWANMSLVHSQKMDGCNNLCSAD